MVDYNYIVKIGSSNTLIIKAGEGILLLEPSVVAVNAEGKVLSAGNAACEECANNDNITLVYPVADGVIKNKQLAVGMLRAFLKQIEFKNMFAKNNVVMLIPTSLNAQEKNDYVNVAYSCMFTAVTLLPTIFAGMVNMEIEAYDERNHVLCKLGGGVCDVAAISKGTIVNACTIDLGGKTLNSAIKHYISDSYHVDLDDDVIENIKCELATLLPNDNKTCEFYSNNPETGVYENITLTSGELRPIFLDYFKRVAGIISGLLSSCDPSVVADILKRGVYVFGGVALVTGVDKYLSNVLGLPVYVDIEPDNTVINGSISMLNDPKLLNLLIDNFNN